MNTESFNLNNLVPDDKKVLSDEFVRFAQKSYQENNFKKALAAYNIALQFNASNIPALEGLTILYILTNQFKLAEEYALILLELDESNFTALLQLMQINSIFKKNRRLKKYIDLLDKYYPKTFRLQQEKCRFATHTCNFDLQNQMFAILNKHNQIAIEYHKPMIENSYDTMPDRSNKPLIFALDKLMAQTIIDKESKYKLPPFQYIKIKKITIGYVSDDFIDHPVAHLISGLFKEHDRRKFKVNIYNHSEEKNDYFLNKIKNSCDKYTNIRDLSNIDAAKLINQDNVDILVDLKGHTAFNRLGIFYHRPAPIQVSLLGYSASTGADFIDYIIADEVVIPPDDYQYYTEKVLLMDRCYQPNDSRKNFIEKHKYTRIECGLPEDAFVFGCFNGAYKIDKAYLDTCFELLKSVDNSVLWILKENRYMQYNVLRYAKESNINLKQIIFSPKLTKDQYLARIRQVDLMLNTFVCHGHTTTGDALYMGIPVLTLHGTYLASRVASSYLTTFGMPELICYDIDEYKQKAIDYATQPAKYQKLLKKVNKQIKKSALFDMKNYCRSLEKALLTLIKH